MSKPQMDDAEQTKKQIQYPCPINGRRTWLGHLADGESGLIDLMILEEKYTIKEMAMILSSNKALTSKDLKAWEKRINDHIEHLATKEGDAKNRASGVGGHNLKIKEVQRKLMFDY